MSNQREERLSSGILEQVERAGRSLLHLLRAAWTEYQHDMARYFAVAMIYYALVSLIPLILLLLSALGLLLRFSPLVAEAQQQVLSYIETSFGVEQRALIEQLVETLQRESIIGTVVGLVGLLATGSLLFRHLRLSFRAIWQYAPPLVSGSVRVVIRATLLEQVMAYTIVLMSGGLLVAALVLIAIAGWLNSLMVNLPLLSRVTGWGLTELSPFAIAFLMFTLLLKFLPPTPLRLRDVWLAALLCALAWWVAGELLSLYVTFFGTSRGAYGALGGVLAVMIWMNIVSQVLFFGAEFCKVVTHQAGNSTS